MKTIICLITSMILSIMTLSAQSFNHEIKTEGSSPMLLGKINNQGLTQEPYNEWFSKNHKEYIPKQSSIDSLKAQLPSYAITLFMGTWCGDSKREVPRMYKILEESNFPLDRLTVVAVDRSREAYKQSPGGEHEGLNIHRVPTLIFYKDGKEVNRIVESPRKTLEEDMLAILSKNYTPKYSSVILMDDILTKKGTSYITKNTKKLVKQFKDKTQSLYELNTYASVLFYADKKEEAITILDFNTALFPKEANTYVSLANTYLYLKDTANAIKYYQKSLEFKDNKEIQDKIKELNATSN
ncbi:thioredoxin domain-containing protein [Aquimarina megaterium]|uniref:thioredoxin domain-containing protein n=1 Tax=Aquimarina megaterium TaxID=1443666 RepID=UPI00046FD419|nr:thioredoxin domain-containing protein [Aquimarina megaterium]